MKKSSPDIEKSLIKGLTLGDEKSYKILFNEYYEWLCNYVYKLTNDRILSEDLVQNVMLRLWEKNLL